VLDLRLTTDAWTSFCLPGLLVYSLIRGGRRISANELLSDAIGAVIAEANPIAGAMYEVGRAALRKNDDDE
jgi:hypothetical protein